MDFRNSETTDKDRCSWGADSKPWWGGYDLKNRAQIDRDDVYSKAPHITRAGIFFFSTLCELGISGSSLAKGLGMSQRGVVYAVNKGGKIANEENYQLLE